MRSLRNKTILIIDNDPDVVRALIRRVESLGHNAVAAFSGAQGLAQFRRGGIDLIISDLNMPCGDGIELAEAVRSTSSTPIVFITGFKDEFKRELRNIPNVTVVRKPFATESLVELIEIELGMSNGMRFPDPKEKVSA